MRRRLGPNSPWLIVLAKERPGQASLFSAIDEQRRGFKAFSGDGENGPPQLNGPIQKPPPTERQNERRNAIIGFPREWTLLANTQWEEFTRACPILILSQLNAKWRNIHSSKGKSAPQR